MISLNFIVIWNHSKCYFGEPIAMGFHQASIRGCWALRGIVKMLSFLLICPVFCFVLLCYVFFCSFACSLNNTSLSVVQTSVVFPPLHKACVNPVK